MTKAEKLTFRTYVFQSTARWGPLTENDIGGKVRRDRRNKQE